MLVLLSLALRLLLDFAQRFGKDGSTMEQFGLPTPQGVDKEVERERLRWNCDEEKAKFTHLCSASPNTEEMADLFVVIKKAIDTAATLFVYIQGECAYYCLPRYAISVVPSRCVVAQVKRALAKQLLHKSCVRMSEGKIKLRWVVRPPRWLLRFI